MTQRRLPIAEFRARVVELMVACDKGLDALEAIDTLRPTQIKHRLRVVQNAALRVGLPMIGDITPTDEEGDDGNN